MLIMSALSSVVLLLLPVYIFVASFFVNFIASPQNFTIDKLPFVVTIHHSDLSEEGKIKKKEPKKADKKSQKKQWNFTESQQNSQQQTPQQPYIQQMKSQIESSSSAIQGTSENATILRTYFKKDNN